MLTTWVNIRLSKTKKQKNKFKDGIFFQYIQ